MRVLVCGSTFGQFYLAALAPPEFTPVGVLARGSERSVAMAERAGLPLFTRLDDVPDDVDMACVAIRSGALGGPGSEVARQLLQRGVHVLQEHPVHHDELAACLRAAAAAGVRYGVGDFYPQLPAVRRFTAAARELRARTAVEYVEAACSVQVLFPLLHILADALGVLRPWQLAADPARAGWTVLHGSIGGLPCALRVQTELDPEHPDDHLQLPHQVTLGTAAGRLALADVHGPVLWHPRLHVPDEVKQRFDVDGPATGHLAEPPTTVLGPAPDDSYRETLSTVWPAAIAADVRALWDGASNGSALLALARLWQDATERLGYPQLRPGQTHQPLPVSVLA